MKELKYLSTNQKDSKQDISDSSIFETGHSTNSFSELESDQLLPPPPKIIFTRVRLYLTKIFIFSFVLTLLIGIFSIYKGYFLFGTNSPSELNHRRGTQYWNHKFAKIHHIHLPPSLKHLQNQVRVLKLDNGITWVYVNDEKLKVSSSAGFRLEAGSFDEFRLGVGAGTAHLLEHSIFLNMTGEEKGRFMNYNAATGPQGTSYMFSTAKKEFHPGFGIYWKNLANFFPEENIKNEIENVNSE